MQRLTKFQTVVTRLMTDDEVERLGERLKLDQRVVDFVLEQFDQARDNCANDGDLTEDDYSDERGRCNGYMSYDDICNDVCEMLYPGTYAAPTPRQQARVEKIVDAFFFE